MSLLHVIFRAGQKPASRILVKLPLAPSYSASYRALFLSLCKYQVYVKILSLKYSLGKILFRSYHRKVQ